MSKIYPCAQEGCRALTAKEGGGCSLHSSNLSKKRKRLELEAKVKELKNNTSTETSQTASSSQSSKTLIGVDSLEDDIKFLKSEVVALRQENFLLKARVSGN